MNFEIAVAFFLRLFAFLAAIRRWPFLFAATLLAIGLAAGGAPAAGAGAASPTAGERRVPLDPSMIRSSSALADFSGLADEQSIVGDPPAGTPKHGWSVPSQYGKQFPFSATIDLGQTRDLAALWIFDTNGKGRLRIAAGGPDRWTEIATNECDRYLAWVRLPLDVTSRYVRIQFDSGGANVAEVALYEHTPDARAAAAARAAALERARTEAASRPWVELPPFGRLRLVDEVNVGAAEPGHGFAESPAGASRVEPLAGAACRVLAPVEGECSYLAFRIGKDKLLRAGAAYVLAVDYPEDAPRSMVVMNGGCETARGFHTGTTVGDALHAKYVDSNPESLRLPLSGRTETWAAFFRLHDRFPELGFIRGKGERPLLPADGFPVALAQFAARDDPTSRGIAVSRIRLLEVPDEAALALPLRRPPSPLPRRHLFWREEMADGVIEGDKESERGVKDRLDWYRFKASQMRWLGIDTYSKDLLEFGACQHWDSTPGGGNAWVHFAWGCKDLWGQIVELMGKSGFSVLPYYEYAGSKGDRGLGYQRRCRPLTRDDAYTHIKWVESANADITDPDTYADFRKMLDVTVLQWKDRAPFEGIWLRPRSQLPMSFAEATLGRFAAEARGGKAVTRAELRADAALLKQYEDWWFGKRREFLAAMRDHLRTHGLPGATVLYTADASEPGIGFPTWEKRIVTDDVAAWQPILADPRQILEKRPVVPIPFERVARENLYLEALQAAPLNWGDWEWQHCNPPADPARYRDVPGVLLTHGFNRLYTVDSPRTFDAFRAPAGLAIVRHHSLNENMMNDRQDQPKLGYFVADVEPAGPYCMMAEAMAVARGDPTLIGYLCGSCFGRGFPQYVRDFDANFLALPALPSKLASGASDDPEIVVREIECTSQGTYVAIVSTGFREKKAALVRLPARGAVEDAATGQPLATADGRLQLDLRPFQLRALRIGP